MNSYVFSCFPLPQPQVGSLSRNQRCVVFPYSCTWEELNRCVWPCGAKPVGWFFALSETALLGLSRAYSVWLNVLVAYSITHWLKYSSMTGFNIKKIKGLYYYISWKRNVTSHVLGIRMFSWRNEILIHSTKSREVDTRWLQYILPL